MFRISQVRYQIFFRKSYMRPFYITNSSFVWFSRSNTHSIGLSELLNSWSKSKNNQSPVFYILTSTDHLAHLFRYFETLTIIKFMSTQYYIQYIQVLYKRTFYDLKPIMVSMAQACSTSLRRCLHPNAICDNVKNELKNYKHSYRIDQWEPQILFCFNYM